MGFFRKRQKQPGLPDDIIGMMERFGRFEFDPQGNGDDAGIIGQQWAELVFPFSQANPEGFVADLAAAILPVGGWAVYGASCTLWECFSSNNENIRQQPSYNAIMNAAIEFLRANHVPQMMVKPYQWQHWLQNGGTRDTWIPESHTS